MSFASEVLYDMYNTGDMSSSKFRSQFPPGTDCFELSIESMLKGNEVELIDHDGMVIDLTIALTLANDQKCWKNDSFTIRITPKGRNRALK